MKSVKVLIYIVGILILTFCSSKNDKDIYKEGLDLIQQSKFDEAIVNFQDVVKNYPQSDKADSSLFEIAKIYQGQVLKNVTPKESLNKSVQTYQMVAEKYPNSKLAGSSLFMGAFILANELKQYKNAEKLYNLYLEKYPNGDLVEDAKVELKNLGKSPEEILNQNSGK